MTLAEFLTARLSDDEEAAAWIPVQGDLHRHGTNEPGWIEHSHFGGSVRHVHDENGWQSDMPNRMLREVAAKRAIRAIRAILARHVADGFPRCTFCGEDWPCADVRDVLSVWSDHPDFDAAWKP